MKNTQCSGSVRTFLKCVQNWTSFLWCLVKICTGNSLPPTFLLHVIYVFIRKLSIMVTYFLTWNELLPWEGIHVAFKILISVLRTSYWLSHKKWKCNLYFMIYVSNFMLWPIEHAIMFQDLEKWDQFRCVVGETTEMKVSSVWFKQWWPTHWRTLQNLSGEEYTFWAFMQYKEEHMGKHRNGQAFIQYKERNTGKHGNRQAFVQYKEEHTVKPFILCQEWTEKNVFRVEAFSKNLQKTELKSCVWLYLESIFGN